MKPSSQIRDINENQLSSKNGTNALLLKTTKVYSLGNISLKHNIWKFA